MCILGCKKGLIIGVLAACRREGGAGSKARKVEGRAEEKMVPQRNGKEPIVWRWPVRMKHSMGEPSQCGCEDKAIITPIVKETTAQGLWLR